MNTKFIKLILLFIITINYVDGYNNMTNLIINYNNTNVITSNEPIIRWHYAIIIFSLALSLIVFMIYCTSKVLNREYDVKWYHLFFAFTSVLLFFTGFISTIAVSQNLGDDVDVILYYKEKNLKITGMHIEPNYEISNCICNSNTAYDNCFYMISMKKIGKCIIKNINEKYCATRNIECNIINDKNMLEIQMFDTIINGLNYTDIKRAYVKKNLTEVSNNYTTDILLYSPENPDNFKFKDDLDNYEYTLIITVFLILITTFVSNLFFLIIHFLEIKNKCCFRK